MNNEVTAAIVAVPSVLLVMAATAGATAQITQADPVAVKRAVITTGAVLVVSAFVSQNAGVIGATLLAVGATMWVVKPIWLNRSMS